MSDFNLGTVTAYGYAKDKGYTGTEDEYAELMASYADVAEEAAESATQAAASATTATTKAGEASQSATAAESSKTAAQTAQSNAETAAQTATTKAGEASTSATTATSKAAEATTAATTATGKATEAAGSATTATTKAGEASTSATNAAASATRAQEILDSIPEDYSQLSDDVSDLKDGLQAVEDEIEGEIIPEIYNVSSYPNVWDDDNFDTGSGTGVTTVSTANGVFAFKISTAGSNKGRYFSIPVTLFDVRQYVGQSLTFSAILDSKSEGYSGNPTVRFNLQSAQGSGYYGTTAYQKTLYTSSRQSVTMPIPNDPDEINGIVSVGLFSGSSSNSVGAEWAVKEIQVEVGTSATPYHKKGEVKNSKIDALDNRVSEIEKATPAIAFTDIIPYNDKQFCNGIYRECYNPYKVAGSSQYKGQLHCHATDNSGTQLSTMQQIYNNYKTLYDFMALTDYGSYADLDNFDTLVALNEADTDYDLIQLFKGYELKVSGSPNYHLIVLNPITITTVPALTPLADSVKTLALEGCIVDFAHPNYSEFTADDAKTITGHCQFIEVWNGRSAEIQWDAMLTNGNFVFGLGVSDCHGTGSAIDEAWIKVFANSKTRDSIFTSLMDGNFYASNGALLDGVSIANGIYTVNTGDANATTIFTKENGDVLATVTGATASYRFDGTEKYVRATVTLSDTTKAWTQPIIFADMISTFIN